MADRIASISGWFGYNMPGGETTVTITGSGFGDSAGSVRLLIEEQATISPKILSWTDKAVVVAAPSNVTIKRAMVYVLTPPNYKPAAITPDGDQRSTHRPSPSWSVSQIDDTESLIIVYGTGLDRVSDVFFYDEGRPQLIGIAEKKLEGGSLLIEWPAEYTGSIIKIILSDGNGGNVSAHPQYPGLAPAANGLIEAVSSRVANEAAIIELKGSGFGERPGTVVLVQRDGTLEKCGIAQNGWNNNVVQVYASPDIEYVDVILTREDTEVATIAKGFPKSFKSALVSAISGVIGDELQLAIKGSGFNDNLRFILMLNWSPSTAYGMLQIPFDSAQFFVTKGTNEVVLRPIPEILNYAFTGLPKPCAVTISDILLASDSGIIDIYHLDANGGRVKFTLPHTGAPAMITGIAGSEERLTIRGVGFDDEIMFVFLGAPLSGIGHSFAFSHFPSFVSRNDTEVVFKSIPRLIQAVSNPSQPTQYDLETLEMRDFRSGKLYGTDDLDSIGGKLTINLPTIPPDITGIYGDAEKLTITGAGFSHDTWFRLPTDNVNVSMNICWTDDVAVLTRSPTEVVFRPLPQVFKDVGFAPGRYIIERVELYRPDITNDQWIHHDTDYLHFIGGSISFTVP